MTTLFDKERTEVHKTLERLEKYFRKMWLLNDTEDRKAARAFGKSPDCTVRAMERGHSCGKREAYLNAMGTIQTEINNLSK